MKQTQFISLFFLFVSVSGLFFSCGIEDYAYLEPVPSGNIQLTLNNRARIDLPPSQGSSFTQYNIYYRIYISDILEAGEIQKSRPAMGNINPALANDYFALEPYTNTNNNNVNASTDILFRNRSYQTLSYEPGLVINRPGVLELYFPDQTGSIPYLIYGGNTYNLYRSNGNSAFNPQPDRYFRNSSEINSSANAISTINADVVDKSGAGGPRYTYAALYIAAEGLNQPSYTPFYSIPTFIGVFMLPARN